MRGTVSARMARQAAARQTLAAQRMSQREVRLAARQTAREGLRGRFAGQAFARAGVSRFTNREWQRWRHSPHWRHFGKRGFRGHFVGWVGPVFWPYFYSDVFDYTFWPDVYDDWYWAAAYDDIYDSMFWPYPGGTWGTLPGGGRTVARSRGRVAPAPEEIAQQLCGEQTQGLTAWPFDRIEQTVSPDERQRAALEQLKEASAKAAETLKASCPRDLRLTPTGRFAALGERLDGMLQAVRIVRPALETLYESLSDEQKARFNALGPQLSEGRARGRQQDGLGEQACSQGARPGLVDVPISRIEAAVRPTEVQRAKLDALRDTSARAAETLQANCPDYTPLTPTGRIEAMEKRLNAMAEAVKIMQPALQDFYDSLSDEQKQRFNRMRPQAVASAR